MCGERRLETLLEKREPRFLLDDVWAEDAVKYCLEAGQWAFATRTVMLQPEPSIQPEFGYRNAFEKPIDWVRTTSVSLDEYLNEPLTAYRDETGYFWADFDPIYVAYVSMDEQYGRDYSKWTPSFTKYVQAYMASQIVPKIQNSITTKEKLEEDMAKYLSEAQGKDAVGRPTRFPSKGSFVAARQRGMYSNKNRRGN